MRRAVVLIDHGSRRDEANAQLDALAARVVERLPDWIVRTAHLELLAPTLGDAIDDCVSHGANEIVIHPFFLTPGRHASADIPRLVAEAAARHPGLSLRTSDILGLHDAIVDVVLERIAAAIPALAGTTKLTRAADRDRRSRPTR